MGFGGAVPGPVRVTVRARLDDTCRFGVRARALAALRLRIRVRVRIRLGLWFGLG